MYNRNQLVHFVGIGGVGMAGIAEVLLNLGYGVSGSDLKNSELVEHLRRLGAQINIGHAAANLYKETTVVVYSSAVDPSNPEIVSAKERHIPVIQRAEMLGELMRMKYGIAIAGSHGKTTTTTMIAKILGAVGFDPTVIIGGRVMTGPSGAKLGSGDYLVAEADESDGSFQFLRPAIVVVTNIDREHLTHYGSFGKLEEAFHQFMSGVPFYGLVVACFDDPVVENICQGLGRRVISYGLREDCNFRAIDIEVSGGSSRYFLEQYGVRQCQIEIPIPGVHFVKNSLAAIAVAMEVGVYAEEAVEALKSFPGVARRSQIIFQSEDYLIIDDYGHHPTEIAATILAIKRSWVRGTQGTGGDRENLAKYSRLIVAFQPHRYSRTHELFSDFLDCFSGADLLYLTDIYSAGELPIAGVSAEKLASSIQHSDVCYVKDIEELNPRIAQELKSGDVVLTLGAGNIGNVGHELAKTLNIALR